MIELFFVILIFFFMSAVILTAKNFVIKYLKKYDGLQFKRFR